MVIYELLKYGITTTHPIMVYFAYYHEMELLCDVYGFHASMIKIIKVDLYMCMLLVG